ncbi:tetratricopeptide repeat-containing S1 family peptidase [Chroococcidiopsis thermalis]|uniref:Tetratricopeptide TPR_1 repeat-containing protein n=1 Tax=Chroococcidiopsis thermalis (strain PCC 7203) TaxID=251229 RepID=K9U5N1_CHRTP|nr:tetratricopeptide repeat-containing serine protease family protein [Chroococcidiopsis thermalis]AFY89564.1 Tetratricopeptide TPR_1 repeat-containing protein [Chroococcidiopsis thermalis PCC 7203]
MKTNFTYPLLTGTVTLVVLVTSHNLALALSPQEIVKIGSPMTVQVNPPMGVKDGGSGVIIQRQGNTYTVLTCNHVALMPAPHTIRTHDGQSYAVVSTEKLQKSPNDPDLALVTFSSAAVYPVAKLAPSNVPVGAEIFVMGFPALDRKFGADRDFVFSPGFVTSRPSSAPEGYTLRYNSVTKGGMSGGPVFDIDGRVVGIHGLGGSDRVDVKQQGSDATMAVNMKTGFNGAIPINTFLAMRSQIPQAPAVAVDTAPSTDKPAQRLENPKSASDFFAKGSVERDRGDRSRAIANYTQAIARNPNYADAYYQRGNARYDQGDKQGALADYDQALKFDPNYANAYYQRAVILYNRGNKQEALSSFDRYITLVPNDAQAYHSRGAIRRSMGDGQGTFDDFDRVVRLEPDNSRAYYNRALARTMLRDSKGALDDFSHALNLDPSWTTVYNNRAILRRRLGDRQGAVDDFSKVISIEPKNAEAHYNRGLVRRDLGDRQGAIEDLQLAANIFQQKNDSTNYQKALEKIESIQAMPVIPAVPAPVVTPTTTSPSDNSTNLNQPTNSQPTNTQPTNSGDSGNIPESAAPAQPENNSTW